MTPTRPAKAGTREHVLTDTSFDRRLIPFWGIYGPRSGKDGVTLTDDGRLRATLGFFKIETPLENVDDAHITRGYRWWTAAGVRGSMKDDGLTFGRTSRRACASTSARRSVTPFAARVIPR